MDRCWQHLPESLSYLKPAAASFGETWSQGAESVNRFRLAHGVEPPAELRTISERIRIAGHLPAIDRYVDEYWDEADSEKASLMYFLLGALDEYDLHPA